MTQKSAEITYDPKSPIEQVVQETYHSVVGPWLSQRDVRQITEGFSNFQGFLEDPKPFCVQVFDHENDDTHAVFPLYALELREILRSKRIVGLSPLVGFGYHAAKRVLKDFTALLVIDYKKLGVKYKKLRGVILFETPTLELGDSVVRFLSRARIDSREMRTVEQIVREEYPRASVHSIVELPGIATPKVAQAVDYDAKLEQMKRRIDPHGVVIPLPKLNKYVVNIPSLGIKHEPHNAKTDEEAVQTALDAKWRATGNPHRGAEFSASTYKVWWPMIVRKASLEISPNSQEQRIFDFLLNVNEKYDLGLTFRVAGGWVRDKAMGKECDDIDVALDKMTGAQFGRVLAQEPGIRKVATSVFDKDGKSLPRLNTAEVERATDVPKPVQDQIDAINETGVVQSVAKTKGGNFVVSYWTAGNIIAANPDQSKHLETLTVRIYGQDVDLVNLRTETYADSRIPEMKFGSAQQDAARRDLTINAMFYNLNTASVEDLTGKGVEDLASMTLRTPIDPVQTFIDDPLRILRVLRFHSRYKDSHIASGTYNAMKDARVQEAFRNKVTQERIAEELKKLCAGEQPEAALSVAYETGILPIILDVPEMNGFHPFTMDQNSQWHKHNVFEHTMRVVAEAKKLGGDWKLVFAALLHDLGKLDPSVKGYKPTVEIINGEKVQYTKLPKEANRNSYHGHEDVSAKVSKAICEKLKLSNDETDYVVTVVAQHMEPHKDDDYWNNKNIRKYLNEYPNTWKDTILHSVADVRATGKESGEAEAAKRFELLARFEQMPPPAAQASHRRSRDHEPVS
jgi:tRNA nucleotidyltransferase/poly(A) polymerase